MIFIKKDNNKNRNNNINNDDSHSILSFLLFTFFRIEIEKRKNLIYEIAIKKFI